MSLFFPFSNFSYYNCCLSKNQGRKATNVTFLHFSIIHFVSQHITGGIPLPHQMTSLPTPSFFASTRYGFITLILLRPKMTLLLVFIRTLSVSYSLTNPKD